MGTTSRIDDLRPYRAEIALGDRPDRATPSPRRAKRITTMAFHAGPRCHWRLRHRARRREAAASIIAALQGDPETGRSALDQRRMQEEAANNVT
jgi:hypothetical protein